MLGRRRAGEWVRMLGREACGWHRERISAARCYGIVFPFKLARWLLERDIHFGVAGRRGCIDRRCNSFNVTARDRPLRVAQDYESDFAPRKILLLPNVFVGR